MNRLSGKELKFSRDLQSSIEFPIDDGAGDLPHTFKISYRCNSIEPVAAVLEFVIGKPEPGINYDALRDDHYLSYSLLLDSVAMSTQFKSTRLEAMQEMHAIHGDALDVINNVEILFRTSKKVERVISYLLMVHLDGIANHFPYRDHDPESVEAIALSDGLFACDGHVWDSRLAMDQYVEIRFAGKSKIVLRLAKPSELLYFDYSLKHRALLILTQNDLEQSKDLIEQDRALYR